MKIKDRFRFSRTYLNKMENNSYRVLQWNTQGITTAKQDIIKLIEIFEPSMFAFPETLQANE